MAEQATQTVNVFIRRITVRQGRDLGLGRGEYDVSFVVAASPALADPAARAGVRWAGSVESGGTHDVGLWTGPVTYPSRHSLVVAGAGEEQDTLVADAVRGGLALFGADHDWGVGRWWRTTNGPDFDFSFFVARIEEGMTPEALGEPPLTADSLDAPGPRAPTQDEYAAAFGAPLQQD